MKTAAPAPRPLRPRDRGGLGLPATGRPRSRRAWPTAVALTALVIVPLTAGALRVVQLAGGPQVMSADARITASPVPLVVHIVGATVYALLGILQFLPAFRTRHRAWHRRAGRVLAVTGLLVAGSALWMTLFFERQPGTGDILSLARLVFATALAASIVLGVAAARRGSIAAHRAWMIRAYAIAVAAGTQVFTEGLSEAVFGSGVLQDDLAKASAWLINLGVAEWIIRRPAHRPRLRRLSARRR